MQTIPFVQEIIEKYYSNSDQDRQHNIAILIILVMMMIFVMGSWLVGFYILEMWEIFWLDVFVFTGFIMIFWGLYFKGMSFTWARFIGLSLTAVITSIPPLFYGIGNIIITHFVFMPIAIIMLFSRKEKLQYLSYMVAFLVLFISVIVVGMKFGPTVIVPEKTFQIFNTIVALDCMFISIYFSYFFFTENSQYKTELAIEREKSDHLLLSIFPETIADQLRNSNQSVADSFDNVTILFADIVGFTQYSNHMTPSELVAMLDEIFSEFDALVDKYGIEKIKTIGDAYMAVGGLPTADALHCHKVAMMALEINDIIKDKYAKKYDLKLRIGIHTGKAVAGVIGNKKFSYDLWGDSVNIASRFEASGHPEKIHITEAVKDTLGEGFLFEDCGEVMIKGKGMMRSYFLMGKREMVDGRRWTVDGSPQLALAI